MQFIPNIEYPENEKPQLVLLENLFREWHKHFSDPNSKLGDQVANGMVFDGFYPHYFSQKKRILFIGWEPVDIEGCNYIDLLFQAYRKGKRIGDRHLNQSAFHYRMIYIAHGILNEMPDWQAIQSASEIGDTFGEPNGLSFAYMNISKLSNEVWQANHDSINTAFQLSTQPRNFIQEEVAILNPDIVITMCKTKKDKINSLGSLTPIKSWDEVDSYWLQSGKKRCLLINAWHFSAHKSDIENFYVPICEAIRHSEVTGDVKI